MTQNEKSKIRAKVIKWVTRLFLILVAIIMLYPLAWNVVSSFKTSTEFLTDPFAWPQGLAWDNYVRAYEKSNLAANIGNSIYVVLETLVIIVVCVVPCSYCLVRYKFPGAKLILNIYMAAIFIQATYIMIPLFLQMNKLNLLNSLTALGVLYATMQFPFAIFLLTGFLRSIPRDYEEAAMIDGANRFQRIVHINLPCILPTIVIMLILQCGNLMSVGFEKVFLMQTPLNLEWSEIISTFVYKMGLLYTQYSFSTAVGLFNSVVNFILLMSVNLLSRRLSEYSLW